MSLILQFIWLLSFTSSGYSEVCWSIEPFPQSLLLVMPLINECVIKYWLEESFWNESEFRNGSILVFLVIPCNLYSFQFIRSICFNSRFVSVLELTLRNWKWVTHCTWLLTHFTFAEKNRSWFSVHGLHTDW